MMPFGQFAPDAFLLDSQLAGDARGVLPGANSYLPWPSLVAVSNPLPAPCFGFTMFRTTAGGFGVIAGTQTRLYRYDTAGTPWTEIGSGYSVPVDEKWNFQQFGNFMHMTNASNGLLQYDVDLGGAVVPNPGSPPAARYIVAWGDQLMLGGLTNFPNYIWLSGRNNPDWWELGEMDCTRQLLPDGGRVTGLSPMETGLIFQEGMVRKILPVANDAIFTISKIEQSRGLVAPDSLVILANVAYYLSEEGWMATDGSGASKRIGVDRIDAWFKEGSNQSRLSVIQGTTDPERSRIYWIIPGPGNGTDQTLDFILCYDVQADKWTGAEVRTQAIQAAQVPSYTMDNLSVLLASMGLGDDLDQVPFSLDSRFLVAGGTTMAAFTADNRLAFFNGPPMKAIIETADFQPVPGKRGFVKGCQPFTDAAAATIAVGRKERPSDATVWTAERPIDRRGWAWMRSMGRIQRVRMTIPAGAAWSHAQGIELAMKPDGAR